MTLRYVSWVLPMAALVAASAIGEPHVHGQGRLALAPTPNGVQLELVVAGADVWGFEHEPRTTKEASRRADAMAAFKDSLTGLLRFPTNLGCVHDSSTVEAEVLGQEDGQAEHHAEEEHENEHEHGHGHQGTRHEEHEHAEGEEAGGHIEVRATASWSCRRSPLGHDVEVRRPPEVPGLSVLEIWVLGTSGQNSTLLRRSSASVRLQ